MHTNFVFDELRLVGKLTTVTKSSHKETPISSKTGRSKVYK
jgi:hypothetical protein